MKKISRCAALFAAAVVMLSGGAASAVQVTGLTTTLEAASAPLASGNRPG